MAKSRKLKFENPRPMMEYLLIAIVAVMFILGIWAYRAGGSRSDNAGGRASFITGTPDELDALTEQENHAELSAEAVYDDDESITSDELENSTDNIGSVYDESAY